MEAEELIESIIRASMFLAGLVGNNWLAVRSLPGRRSGLRTSELLFINLAVSNLITTCLVDLPDTVADFAGRWFLGETFCGVFRFCADLSETSSIYTTFFISVFWHQKLVGSLRRGGAAVRLDSPHLVGCLLAGSWTVAVVFGIPHFFFVSVEGGNGSHEDCIDVFPNALARQTYDIFYLTLANALPVAGIVFVSVQIVITLLQKQRRIRGHGSDPGEKTAEAENKIPDEGSDGSEDPGSQNVYTGAPPPPPPPPLPVPSPPNPGPTRGGSGASPVIGEADAGRPSPPRPGRLPARPRGGPGTQARAAKSVVAVASVFLVCWLTHLLLRITNSIHTSSVVVEVASYIAASYTCVIPYIFLHGVKKLSCTCKR